MKKSITSIGGFAGLRESEPFVTTAENKKSTKIVIDDWMLGPENPSNEPDANKTFWVAVGKAMQVDETEARRRRCSNCEYYDNSTLTQAKMERIPRNQWDDNAGFRGFCTKFEFVCHDLRVCQAWDEHEFEFED